MLTVLRGRTMIDVFDAAIAGVGLAVLYTALADYSPCRRWIRECFLLWPDTENEDASVTAMVAKVPPPPGSHRADVVDGPADAGTSSSIALPSAAASIAVY